MINNKQKITLVIAICCVLVAGLVFATVSVAKNAMAENQANYIGPEKAKEIALTDSKLNASDVTFTRSKLSKDDNLTRYDVEFYTNNAEYEYDIDASTGVILDKDSDKIKSSYTSNNSNNQKPNENSSNNSNTNSAMNTPNNNSNQANSTQSNSNATKQYIGVEKAKSIALSNVKVSGVRFTEANLDYDDGIAIYEITFHKGYTSYEYTIHAINGRILDKEIDYDDDHTGHDD